MSCHNGEGRRSKKKRIIKTILVADIAATGIGYVSLAANRGAAAIIPAVLAFAACPAMCAAMGGGMWMSRRFKRRNNNTIHTQLLNNKNISKLATKNTGFESQSDDNNNNNNNKEIIQVQHRTNVYGN